MGLEVAKLAEGFGTTRMPTFVRFVSGVRSDVLLEVRQLSEFALTNFTPGNKSKQ